MELFKSYYFYIIIYYIKIQNPIFESFLVSKTLRIMFYECFLPVSPRKKDKKKDDQNS